MRFGSMPYSVLWLSSQVDGAGALIDHFGKCRVRCKRVVDHRKGDAPAAEPRRHGGGCLVAQFLPVAAMDEYVEWMRARTLGQKQVEDFIGCCAIGQILIDAAGLSRFRAFFNVTLDQRSNVSAKTGAW